jgi:hypothetical protein
VHFVRTLAHTAAQIKHIIFRGISQSNDDIWKRRVLFVENIVKKTKLFFIRPFTLKISLAFGQYRIFFLHTHKAWTKILPSYPQSMDKDSSFIPTKHGQRFFLHTHKA